MRKVFLDTFVGLLADVTDADNVVLYLESEDGLFSPVASFSLYDMEFVEFTEAEEGLLPRVVKEWVNYLTDDEAVLGEWPLYSGGDYIPKVFMAFPFKVGKRRALLCFDSRNLGSFTEKQQNIAKRAVELVKLFYAMSADSERLRLYMLKLSAIEELLELFSRFSPTVAFSQWSGLAGFDLAGLYRESDGGGLKPVCLYRGVELDVELEQEVGARSIFHIAHEKGESYLFDLEKGEFFPGYEAYGVVIPVDIPGFRGVFFATSSDEDFFHGNALDVLKIMANFIAVFFAQEEEKRTLVSPVEAENVVKILCNRAQKEGRVLAFLLFIVKGIDKEYSKRGFWFVERQMEGVIGRVRTLGPALITRLGGHGLLVAEFFSDEREAVEYKISFNSAVTEVADFRECETELFLYPTRVERVEDLFKEISERLAKSVRKGFLV